MLDVYVLLTALHTYVQFDIIVVVLTLLLLLLLLLVAAHMRV